MTFTRSEDPLLSMVPRRVGGMPTSAFLQLSDRCNHACLHCYQVHGERGELTTAQVEHLLDDLAAAGVLFVTFSGGEITLRKDLFDLIAHARRLQFAVRIFTNAYLVDDAMAQRLADLAVLDVSVSVYSVRPEVHDGITLVPGSLERTLRGVRALRRHGVQVMLKIPLMSTSGAIYREVIEFAKENGCGYVVGHTIEVREDGHRDPIAMRASDEALRRLLADPEVPLGGRERPRPRAADALACGACATATVMPDGTVRPCTNLPYSLGDVRDRPIADVYQDSDAVRFILGLRWKDLPACGVCQIKDYCSRCHASALLEDGDLLGPATASCRWARLKYHHVAGTQSSAGEPTVGPYGVRDDGALEQLPWDKGARQVPAEMPSALVRGRERHRRVRLRVLAG